MTSDTLVTTARKRREDARMLAVFELIPFDLRMHADEMVDALNEGGCVEGFFRTPRAWNRHDVYEAIRHLRNANPDLNAALTSTPSGYQFSEDLNSPESRESREWRSNTLISGVRSTVNGMIFPLITDARQQVMIDKAVARLVEDIRDTLGVNA